jgi:predicted transcriptional regulator
VEKINRIQTQKEVSKILGVSEPYLSKLAKQGKIEKKFDPLTNRIILDIVEVAKATKRETILAKYNIEGYTPPAITINDVKLKHEAEKTRITTIKRKELEGSLVDKDNAISIVKELSLQAKERLMNGTLKLSQKIKGRYPDVDLGVLDSEIKEYLKKELGELVEKEIELIKKND